MKRILAILLSITLIIPYISVSAEKKLPDSQREMADRIARICEANYERYGVLPSVCVAQAFIESTLGQHCSGYNMWGIRSGAENYGSLEEGVLRYLEVINNGCYENAPFQKDYRKQLKAILDGGYCEPVGNYYENAVWSIETYGFDEYDNYLLKKIKRKARKEQQRKKFKIVYDSSVPEYQVKVNKTIIRKGTIMFSVGQEVVMSDVIPGANGRVIKTSRKELCGIKVHIFVFENAVG